MSKQEQILQLLGTGLSNEVVASAAGVTPSYISQLMADEIFRNKVSELRSVSLMSATARDKDWDTVEKDAIGKLVELMPFITKPRELLQIATLANKAVRRGVRGDANITNINQTIVTLRLPQQPKRNITISATGEVVEVEGQTLVTMPATQLLRNLADKAKEASLVATNPEDPNDFSPTLQSSQDYEKALRYLPVASDGVELDYNGNEKVSYEYGAKRFAPGARVGVGFAKGTQPGLRPRE